MLFVAAGTVVLLRLLVHVEIVACQLLFHLLLFAFIVLLLGNDFLIHTDDLIGFLLLNEAAVDGDNVVIPSVHCEVLVSDSFATSWICHVVFTDDVSVLALAILQISTSLWTQL